MLEKNVRSDNTHSYLQKQRTVSPPSGSGGSSSTVSSNSSAPIHYLQKRHMLHPVPHGHNNQSHRYVRIMAKWMFNDEIPVAFLINSHKSYKILIVLVINTTHAILRKFLYHMARHCLAT